MGRGDAKDIDESNRCLSRHWLPKDGLAERLSPASPEQVRVFGVFDGIDAGAWGQHLGLARTTNPNNQGATP
jgi:hypothetical protein